MPAVRSHTVRLIARASRRASASVVYPTFRGERGHPPLVCAELFPEIVSGDGEGGLRAVLARHEARAGELAVLDEGVLMDLDTPLDHARACEVCADRGVPSPAECAAILAEVKAPEPVVRHGEAVAEVARRVAARLNGAGLRLDVALVSAAGLLHDVAKGRTDHTGEGARLLRRLGFPRIARVVALHTDLELAPERELSEEAVVYLADKLVRGDRVVSLDDRFRAALGRCGDDPAGRIAVTRRWQDALAVAAAVERLLGARVEELIAAGRGEAGVRSGSESESESGAGSESGSESGSGMGTVVLGAAESLCPVCLARIGGRRMAVGEDVYLEKRCPEHGEFRTILWRGPPSYSSWTVEPRPPSPPPRTAAQVRDGCPFDCGLCPDHRQHTCCVLLEVTQRCDLGCPFCFARSTPEGKDPDLGRIERWYRLLLERGGPYNIQLSGGEPTLRDDLPEVVAMGRSLGFRFVQLNTNGLRLGRDAAYLRRLKEAGLGCVFMQFDGVTDAVHQRIRGAALLEVKKAAIARCAEEGLGVVLVPTLVPGVNTDQLGAVIAFALERAPAVRGVHFQPASFFGRYPRPPDDRDRITIPEVMTAIEEQTAGSIRVAHLRPPSAENAHCSFQGTFVRQPDGTLRPSAASGGSTCCAPGPGAGEARARPACCAPRPPGEEARAAREAVARRWTLPAEVPPAPGPGGATGSDSLDAFLQEAARSSFSISGMAFQDAWNIDLERVRDCFIHVVGGGERIVPFCAYNVTDVLGRSLYRETDPSCPSD
jgi:hypothetical protein